MKDFFQICYIVFLLSVTFNQYFVHSQGKIDSLYVELEKYDSDSNKARLLIKINEELKAKYSIANNLFKIGEYNKSINILNELILRYQSNKDTFNTSKALLLLGKNYNLKGYKDSALVYIRNAIKTSKILDNKTIYCNILQFCGNIYYEMGYSDSSLFYYHKALDISEEIRYLTFIPELHLNIAKIHNQYFNFEQEIKYLNLAKEEFSILGNQNGIARCRLNLGYNLGDNGYYKEAINEYLQSYKIFTQLNDFENQSIASLNIGKTYKKIEMLDSSIFYL